MTEKKVIVLVGTDSLAVAMAKIASADQVHLICEMKAGDLPILEAKREPLIEPLPPTPYAHKPKHEGIRKPVSPYRKRRKKR